MTEQDQIKAIAELDGWILEPSGKDSFNVFHAAFWRHPDKQGEHTLPNYLYSRDAIIPVIEKVCIQKHSYRGNFNAELFQLTTNRNLSSAIKEPNFIFAALTASAAQLSEALLRATGKWVD